MTNKTSCRDAFGTTLIYEAEKNKDIVVLDADLASSTRLEEFKKHFPDRFIQVGIAEQNMVGIAAGLSLKNKIPVCATFATFISRRACDQVAMSVAYPFSNVKLAGAYLGLLSGNNGATHQSVEDIAIMRSIPNMLVVEPADHIEMKSALPKLIKYNGPVYLRVGRDIWPQVNDDNYEFEIGKARVIKEGRDITLIASGMMVSQCIEAAILLSEKGIDAEIINVSTIKPIDKETIVNSAQKTRGIVTAENHSIIGGLGGAVAELISSECPVFIERIGMNDKYGECGSNKDLLKKYGMDVSAIIEKANCVLNKNN